MCIAVDGSSASHRLQLAIPGWIGSLECPNCSSHDVHRSQRYGLYEGLVFRMARRAPFRCENCHLRFSAFWPRHPLSTKMAHTSLASYLGIPEAQQSKFNCAEIITLVVTVVILLGVRLVMWLTRPVNPIEPPTVSRALACHSGAA